jgi:hypothetical protein
MGVFQALFDHYLHSYFHPTYSWRCLLYSRPMPAEASNPIALAVDLDGTLVCSDLFLESALTLIRQNPFSLFSMFVWLLSGRAVLKRRIAERVTVDPKVLPYLEEVLQFVREQQAAGRHTVLATGSDELLVQPVSAYLGCFDSVIASDGSHNCTGRSKARQLTARYGEQGFDYIGNSTVDLPVWRGARQALLAARSTRISRRLSAQLPLQRVFHYPPVGWAVWVEQLYVRRWVANSLVFAPLLLGPRAAQFDAWLVALVAFVVLNLCSSGAFLALDLLNLSRHRRGAQAGKRGLADGSVYLNLALLLAPLLLLAGVIGALVLPMPFVLLVFGYSLAVMCLGLDDGERMSALLRLAVLPALSCLGGSVALGIPLAHWLQWLPL